MFKQLQNALTSLYTTFIDIFKSEKQKIEDELKQREHDIPKPPADPRICDCAVSKGGATITVKNGILLAACTSFDTHNNPPYRAVPLRIRDR